MAPATQTDPFDPSFRLSFSSTPLFIWVIPVYSTLIESGTKHSNERETMDPEGTGRIIHHNLSQSLSALLLPYALVKRLRELQRVFIK